MKLVHVEGKLVLKVSFEERLRAKEAGFAWNGKECRWETEDFFKAWPFRSFAADDFTASLFRERELREEESRRIRTDVGGHQRLYDFQRAGLQAMLRRAMSGDRGVLLADEMGLGKTVQALTLARVINQKCLVICPATLRATWAQAAKDWGFPEHLVVSVNARELNAHHGRFPRAEVVIINYEAMLNNDVFEAVKRFAPTLVIFDEAHFLKNPDARRTRAALGFPTEFRVFLTGTPMLNRPVELFPLLRKLEPHGIGNSFWDFAETYCGKWVDRWSRVHVDGATNMERLNWELRTTCMIRRLKREVLTELPPKIREIVPLTPEGSIIHVINKGRWCVSLVENSLDIDEAVRILDSVGTPHFEEISNLRQEMALKKAGPAFRFIEDTLDADDSKIVVFGVHRQLLEEVHERLGDRTSVLVYGGLAQELQRRALDRFQNDPDCRVLVASMLAFSVGHTFTNANRVILLETPWRPADIEQAEDRCHRIGQTETVICQHLVWNDSFEVHILKGIFDKMRNQARILE